MLQLLDPRPAEERDFRDPENVLFEDGAGGAFATLGALGVAPGAALSLHSLAPPTPGRAAAEDADKARRRARDELAPHALTQHGPRCMQAASAPPAPTSAAALCVPTPCRRHARCSR